MPLEKQSSFTALVLPLSTLIADEVFILPTYSYIYIYAKRTIKKGKH